MASEVMRIGVLFNALVCIMVAFAAIAYALFLSQRPNLNPTLRGFIGFWIMTALVWSGIAIRYTMVGLHILNEGVFLPLELFIRFAVFGTGPFLYFYLMMRITDHRGLAWVFSSVVAAVALAAWVLTALPGGIENYIITVFSAEPKIHPIAFTIFAAVAGFAILLMLYDTVKRLTEWYRTKKPEVWHASLYSVPLILYASIGMIDQSKVVLDWPLLVFRMLYIAAFLFGYVIVRNAELLKEKYFIPLEQLRQTKQF